MHSFMQVNTVYQQFHEFLVDILNSISFGRKLRIFNKNLILRANFILFIYIFFILYPIPKIYLYRKCQNIFSLFFPFRWSKIGQNFEFRVMKSSSRRSRYRVVWNKSFLKFEGKELRKFEGCTQGSNFSTLSDHVRLLLLVELGKRDLVMFTGVESSV